MFTEKKDIFQIAKSLVAGALTGSYTREEYFAYRARLFAVEGIGECAEEVDAYLMEREKDRAEPYGGFVFRWEGVPPYIERIGGRERISPVLLAQTVRAVNHIINLESDKGCFARFYYLNGIYAPCSDERLRERIQSEIFSYDKNLCRAGLVNETAALIANAGTSGSITDLDSDENVVVFKNCVLRLDTLETEPHSPEILSTVMLDAEWTHEAGPTPVFDSFIRSLCGDDGEKERLIKQFMGLCLTNVPGFKTKKAMFMFGKGNTGKSVAKSLVENILGQGNYAVLDLSDLENDRFASSQLYCRRLAGTSDMSGMRLNELAMFKRLTGGDRIYAQFKGKNPFSFRYRGLLWFCMNELPRFGGDRGDWVYDRMIIFRCDNVIDREERDPDLLEKLFQERNGIASLLVCYAREVVFNGYRFARSSDEEENKKLYSRRNNAVDGFFSECCVMRGTRDISIADECTSRNIYEVFRLWCRDNNGGYVPGKKDFKKRIAELLETTPEELMIKKRNNHYYIFTLNEDTVAEFSGTVYAKIAQ